MKFLPTLLLLALATACTTETPAPEPAEPAVEEPAPEPEAEAMPEEVKRAAELSAAIKADPARAAEILTEKGSSMEELEGMLFDIAADTELSAAYATAMGS